MSGFTNAKKYLLGLHYFFTIFLGLVLVPYFTGLDPSITFIVMGIGTLIFHFLTKRVVPFFVGPSIAFITCIAAVIMPAEGNAEALFTNLAFVKGGLIIAAIIYFLLSILIHLTGHKALYRLFPAVVTAPLMIAIGLKLSGYIINGTIYQVLGGESIYSDAYLTVSIVTITLMVLLTIFSKKRIRPLSLFIAFAFGYITAFLLGLVDTSVISEAPWFAFSNESIRYQLTAIPKFSLRAIVMIAPIALVVLVQLFGELKIHEIDTGRNYLRSPGLNRTLLGNGIITLLAAISGASAPVMHLDHQSIMTDNKVYNARIIRLGAVIAILLGLFGKLDALLTTLPIPLMSSVGLIILGSYAVDGFRLLVHEQVDFTQHRNILITLLILGIGIGIDAIPISGSSIYISGLFVATVIGVILNIILPEPKSELTEV